MTSMAELLTCSRLRSATTFPSNKFVWFYKYFFPNKVSKYLKNDVQSVSLACIWAVIEHF